MKKVDLTGQKYGRLFVDGFAYTGKRGSYWNCICECGGTKIVCTNDLRSGKCRSCGCLQNESRHQKSKDLTGRTFNELTVIKRADDYINPNIDKHYSQWLCRCSCGKTTVVTSSNLISGHTKTCGANIHMRKPKYANVYDLSGEYGIGYDNNGGVFKFDLEDYELVKPYYWIVADGRVVTTFDKQNIYMHRLVMSAKQDEYVDHIHHDTTDNRKSELRLCSNAENIRNRGLLKNNTSGVTGVYFYKAINKWAAQIVVNGKTIYLGRYVNKDDAINARKIAEEKYFGEFRYQGDNKVASTQREN